MESRPNPKDGRQENVRQQEQEKLDAAIKSLTGAGIRFQTTQPFSQQEDSGDLEIAGFPTKDEETGKQQFVIGLAPSFGMRDILRENNSVFSIIDPETGKRIQSISLGGRSNHFRIPIDALLADKELLLRYEGLSPAQDKTNTPSPPA